MAGQKRHSREFWADQVRRWRASGEQCRAFARRAGLNPSTLSWWAWKVESETEHQNDEATSSNPEPLPFVELMPVTIDGRIELEIDDATIRVPKDFDAETLAQVIAVLRSSR